VLGHIAVAAGDELVQAVDDDILDAQGPDDVTTSELRSMLLSSFGAPSQGKKTMQRRRLHDEMGLTAPSAEAALLDEHQQAATTHGDGPALVLAGPRIREDTRHRRARRSADR
jgi:hypothetical protein